MVTIYFVESYTVKKDRNRKYKALMKRIHKSLRQHERDVPELLSYRTFEAGKEGSLTRFVEMFEFANQRGMKKFFGRFPKTRSLRALQQDFHKLVPRCLGLTWTELLKDEWLVR